MCVSGERPYDRRVYVGDEFEVDVERVAHGGHCVGRVPGPDGRQRVVFVRHALPAERVRAVVTSVEKSFVRADAVDVLVGSPHRVQPPCPLAHPDGCGGCDFQHADLPTQRALKEDVIAEQLQRLAGLDVRVPFLSHSDPCGGRDRAGHERATPAGGQPTRERQSRTPRPRLVRTRPCGQWN